MADNQDYTPVYLFTGFLESGKTTFIQDTLQDEKFNDGTPTLLLLCEEGETEYEPSRFSSPEVACRVIEDESELTEEHLDSLMKETGSVRVIVEYNGMWLLDKFYSAMPEDWAVCQEFCFLDSRTIMGYNANMRQLTYDKLQSCEMAVFNRCSRDTDQMELHKLVRGASKRADIIYEFEDGKIEFDQIEDPLPFDLDAPVVVIRDEDYATFYRDLSDDSSKYEGKTVLFTGRLINKQMEPGNFIFGRHVMTCCVEDIQFAALIGTGNAKEIKKLTNAEWYTIKATIHNRYHKNYGSNGPVLDTTEIRLAKEPDPEVATFY